MPNQNSRYHNAVLTKLYTLKIKAMKTPFNDVILPGSGKTTSLPSSIFLTLLFIIFLTACQDHRTPDPVPLSNVTATYSADVAIKWISLELKLVKTTAGFTPPIVARALGYTGLVLYESVVPGMSTYKSLAGQLNGLPALPQPDATKEYNWALAANTAQYALTKSLYPTTSDANKLTMDSLRLSLEASLKAGVASDVVDRSNLFGTAIATAIFEYSKTDGGHEAYKNVFPTDYVLPAGPGLWVSTSAQLIPLLPYWGSNRSFVAANASVNPPAPYPYSTATNSDFYKDALEVYTASKNLTTDQKNIGLFWADGGGSITPPGHHINIAAIVLKKENARLDKAAETCAKVTIAVSDAFVACWRAKYTYNVLRPITYIRSHIDPTWTPLLDTPPFPEYTSGHSSGSGAASQILTDLFGDNYAFTDDTWQGTFTNRSFNSFFDYANEATISRLYGGIHFRNGNEKGIANGKLIGKNINALAFKK